MNEMGLNFNMVFLQNGYGYTPILDIYPTLRNPYKVDISVNWSSILAPNVSNNVQTNMAPNEHKVIEIPSSLQMGLVEQSMKGVTIRVSYSLVYFIPSKFLLFKFIFISFISL